MKTMSSVLLTFMAAGVLAAGPQAAQAGKTGPWKSLFDGKTLDAWRIYKRDTAPKLCEPPQTTACWEIKDGVLMKDGNANDMITKEQFGDFELELDWQIGKAGNSGIFYRGTEEYNAIYWSAPEYQLLDNIDAADNKRPDHLAGSMYEFSSPPPDAVKAVGEWNQLRIIAKGNHIEHWLNGKKTAEFDIGNDEWNAKLAASKFKVYPNFARAAKGHFGVQGNHPGTLALRNIRVREIQ
jgi:hypothetical protein